MLGIIGAMDVEVDMLKGALEAPVSETVSGIDFVSGRLWGTDVVIAKCGIGKVFAAACAEAMILKYAPDAVINTGVGGALSETLSVTDVVVATDLVQHDMDTSALGDPVGLISGINKVKIETSGELSARLAEAVRSLEIRCLEGTVASGDKFVASESDKNYIKETFGAVCCEMEGAAIGQVCYVNNTPFAVLRAISDSADGSSHMDYPTFVKKAAANSCKVIERMIKG